MTQTSLPQAGSSVGDSGPYTADDWAKFYEIVFTGDQAATQGALLNYLNELEVTAVGNTISIDTGAGFCYGHWLLNDTSVDITANACAGVETRWDRVVLVQNETAVAYNTNLLLPAAYAAGVPRNSCRIAILRGVCGSPGVLPTLLTGPNYYMVEIARYQVTGGSTGTITDHRDFCNFSTEVGTDQIENRTRRFWIPALLGWNNSEDTIIHLSRPTVGVSAAAPTITLPDGDFCTAFGRGVIPSDWNTASATATSTAILLAASGGGNISRTNGVTLGECGQHLQSHVMSTGQGAEAMDSNEDHYSCVGQVTMDDPVTTDDILSVHLQRHGSAAEDTVNNAVYMLGWIIEYPADS